MRPSSSTSRGSGLRRPLGERVEPASFVVMHDVLEHIEDDHATAARVADLLEPGGLAIISSRHTSGCSASTTCSSATFGRYTKRSLIAVLRDRFEIEASGYYGAALIPVGLWFSRWTKRPYPIATGSAGAASKVFRAVCQAESRVPMQMGTSLIVRARKRA